MKEFKISKMLVVLCLALMISILSACSDTGEENTEEPSVSEETSNAETGNTDDEEAKEEEQQEATTKMYTTLQGEEVEIPVNPQRVVTDFSVGALLKLGIKPVGAVQEYGLDNPHFPAEEIEGIEDIGSSISLEKVTSLNPDLIITISPDQYESLSKIAPTILIPYGSYDNFEDELLAYGEIVNKTEEAEAWIADFKVKISEAKQKLEGVIGEDETAGIYQYYEKAFYVYGNKFGRGGPVIYDLLGLKMPDKIQEMVDGGEQWGNISLEVLPEYAADHMFLTDNAAAENGMMLSQEVLDSSIYQNLAKENEVYVVDPDRMWYDDPYAIEGQLEDVVELLLAVNSSKE
ncbi:ABC transporter substrate-binding protein [Longirhabdus pacifica]|uniref:ABC transporter substrate-binding protein n=1 Tax=Longirhabdus pacifica TaxID=2305227 RepID=UPI00100924D0|nr:ABC transporter substrate-binding protein [Longirhabdus pacifica]